MTDDSLQARLLALLADIAPDIDPASIVPEVDLREQFDFDSMDALHFATAVSREFGIEISDSDYGALSSLAGARRYVAGRLGASC